MPNRPIWSRVVVALVFAGIGLSDLAQVPGALRGDDAIPRLGVLHLVAGIPGILTAVGAWRMTRWAWLAALAWAAATASLVLSLESLLQLPAEESRGFVPAASVIAVVGALVAWYLFRTARRVAGNAASTPAD